MKQPLPDVFLQVPLAHRALHDVNNGRPENSRAAVRAAVSAGYGIEIDVQCSADEDALVFHDYSLERLAEADGPVRGRAAADLRSIRLRGGDGEGIPTLPEVLELVAGQVPLLIEIKDQDGVMGPDIGGLGARVAEALGGYAGPVAVMSFNPHAVAEMARLLPQVPRGLVTDPYEPADWPLPDATCERLRAIPDYGHTGSSFISHKWQDLGRPRVAELREQGADILCWTVKSAADEAEARRIAQNITFEQYTAPLRA
ncbi:glycerophosphodiester phosphodiesterase family protein [uncultured Roseobacter sp.]|uniref:glycerophosphodiester phosphodiesterase family protein n=1 Tax=uncultured Roseobacter sp. TaxID=114847 RepID=UPI002609C93C|nr:glycerophosphodiester phosphodiesterase family protein [uncultured Roseobacter sp.]